MTSIDKPHQSNGQRPVDHMSLEDIVHRANKVGMEYCDAKQVSERLELLKPSERAKAMEKYDDGSRSEAKIKRMAEVDPDYIGYLEKLNEAKAQADKLRLRYDSFKNLFEARRSLLSYQKAEMRLQ